MKKLNSTKLKFVMAFLMLLDHLRFINGFIPPELVFFFNIISRCVAPMFAYFAVEGILHTRNLKKYCLRLFLLSGIMFLGNTALNMLFKAFSNSLSESNQKHLFINNNVIFTLALGVLCISFILWAKEKEKATKISMFFITAICFITGFLWGEWGTIILPFMIITYFLRDKKIIKYVGYVILKIVAILIPFSEPFYFIVFPLIWLYNGKRGTTTNFNKYFFYVFYPLHLWIIFFINFFIMTN